MCRRSIESGNQQSDLNRDYSVEMVALCDSLEIHKNGRLSERGRRSSEVTVIWKSNDYNKGVSSRTNAVMSLGYNETGKARVCVIARDRKKL